MATPQPGIANRVVIIVITLAIAVLVVAGMSNVLSSVADSASKSDPDGSLASDALAQKELKAESFDEKIQRYVTKAYSTTSGLQRIPSSDLLHLAEEICSDLQSGGEGRLYLPEHVSTPDAETIDLAIALNYAYATNIECTLRNEDPADNFFRELFSILAIQGEDAAAEWASQELSTAENSSETPRDLALYQHLSSISVICRDGSSSYAGGKQGACSWHGGVAD